MREFTRKFKPKAFAIQDENGGILWKDRDILQRRKPYCENLDEEKADAINKEQVSHIINKLEPSILKNEVEKAVAHLILNKALGTDC